MDTKTEGKAWYRLLKVLYGTGWVMLILITLFAFYVLKPSGRAVMVKSGFTCPNGKSYVWNNYSGYYYYTKNDMYLNENDNVSALKTCGLYTPEYLAEPGLSERKSSLIAAGVSEAEVNQTLTLGLPVKAREIQQKPPYKLNWVTDLTDGRAWVKSIGWSIAVFFVTYFILETIKNIVLYVAFGKRFSYPLIQFILKS